MNPNTVRSQFLDFFRERGHTIVPSAPVTPHNDPTLLFTNAGMNQFKDVFLEQGSRPYTRVADSQKVIRVSGKHNDLEEVGPSPSHHTFFEMLGNWSFGDYYKREACSWAWELLTKVWGLDGSRLYATVFKGDDQVGFDEESFKIWRDEVGLPEERISLHGKKDNFWEMGEVGPCGPCSELHYDFGRNFCTKRGDRGHVCVVNGDCGRFVELWNLVFIQYRRDEKGLLHPLPRKHVDTGAGFERILKAIEQKGDKFLSNYDTSIFKPLIEHVANAYGKPYTPDQHGKAHRIVADHIRMISFAIADGVLPSNDGRGYVVRRVLRRASWYAREFLGLGRPFLFEMVEPLISVMGDAYPELKERHGHIVGVIKSEEESFGKNLDRGRELFEQLAQVAHRQNRTYIHGDDAFKLHDTYGFPLDLTQILARGRVLTVDTARFDELMNEQKVRARGDRKFAASSSEVDASIRSKFVGFDQYEIEATIVALEIQEDFVNIVLDKTPFYAESGGQVSDHGYISLNDVKLEMSGVNRTGDVITHRIDKVEIQKLGDTLLHKGATVFAVVNRATRIPTEFNHTATHLLHTALRRILGAHANQAGSLVAPDRLRFDFTHFEKITEQQVEQIERMVNEAIRADYEVRWYEKPIKEALGSGIVALFGEKYGEIVRIIHIGGDEAPYSREFCGGCHVTRTGQIGMFRIVTEGAVSAGVRRIEAVTGEYAYNWMVQEHKQLEAVQDIVGSRGSDPVEKLQKTIAEKKALEKELEKLIGVWATAEAVELLSLSIVVDNVHIVHKLYDVMDIERLKMVGDAIRSKEQRSAALLVSTGENGAGQLVCVVGDDLIKEGKLKAGDLVGKAAKIAGGGGGGRPHMATAGTKTPEKLGEAVKAFEGIVREILPA